LFFNWVLWEIASTVHQIALLAKQKAGRGET